MQDRDRRRRIEAIGLISFAGLLFVIMNAIVKGLITEHHPVMLIWARYFFHVATVVLLFPRQLGGIVRTTQVTLQFGRSVLLLLSTIANFLALIYLPLGEVAAITFTSPILVAGLAVLVLQERVGWVRWLAIGLGLAGALMVIRPLGAEINLGALLAFLCAVAYALYQISTRIVREADPIISLFFGGLVGMVAMSLVVPFFWTWPGLGDLVLFSLTGALGAIGHLLVIMALQRAEASKVSPFIYLQLVWAMLASLLVFGDVPDLMTSVGALVIVASGLWVYWLDVQRRAPLVPASEPRMAQKRPADEPGRD